MQENTAAEDAQAFGTSPDDPVFVTEQAHLSEVYAELEKMRGELVRKMEATSAAAARDKLDLLSEISNDFTSDTETSETYASYGAVNSVIDSYNAQQEVTADKLARCRLLLRQPYFAKVALRFKPGQPPKELYIGAAGISDDNYKRLVVDWRSPVAETYYNQSNGATSYVANGRTIHVDLACRRQFDIEADTLHAYFDTTVAIQDALLLESLSHQRTAQMKAITATIQREQMKSCATKTFPHSWWQALRAAARRACFCSASHTCSTKIAPSSTRAKCSLLRRTRFSAHISRTYFLIWENAIPKRSRGRNSQAA